MSSYDDDEIQFDFFDDEPETAEAPARRRRGGGRGEGPRRPPLRAPTGLVPLARLVGLVAIAIAIVVGLVFWVGACQGKSRHDEYASYADEVRTIAAGSHKVGQEFASRLIRPGLKLTDLETSLQQWSQQEQQAYDQAQQIRPPGPLRQVHQEVLATLQLRAMGLAGLANALALPANQKDAATFATALAEPAKLLTSSDVVWTQLYRQPATQELQRLGITGVVIPPSQFLANEDLVSNRSFQIMFPRLHGASTGGTPSGLHGSSLVSTRAVPQGATLSTSTPTKVTVSADLAFEVTLEDSGNFQEVSIPVTMKIVVGKKTIVTRRKTVPVIQPAERKTVSFGNLNLPPSAFANNVTIAVVVGAVPGEQNTGNNKASYPVFFSLSQ
jgi:hypothetical protein